MFACLMVFNTFNNISVIWWRSVLLVEETGGPGENHQPVASHWQTLCHIMLYTSPWSRFELTTSVVIGTDSIDSCKSNYQPEYQRKHKCKDKSLLIKIMCSQTFIFDKSDFFVRPISTWPTQFKYVRDCRGRYRMIVGFTRLLPYLMFACLMVFNTFNNISVIWWRSVLLVEETRGPGENHQPVASHWQTLFSDKVHRCYLFISPHVKYL
jgi:hypothetical protein